MDCKLASRLISSRIDGELETGDGPALEAHLGSCPACQALQGAERRMRDAIRAAATASESPPVVSPAQILLRSRRAFAEEISIVRALQRVAALAAVLLFASGLAVFSPLAVPSPSVPEGRFPKGTSIENSIRVVASSEAPFEALIDQENSIVIGFGPPAFTDGDWMPEEQRNP